jgi:hypothetical protein
MLPGLAFLTLSGCVAAPPPIGVKMDSALRRRLFTPILFPKADGSYGARADEEPDRLPCIRYPTLGFQELCNENAPLK